MRALADALVRQDSVALQGLSARGDPQTLLCVARHWPDAYFTRTGGRPQVRYRGRFDRRLEYRLIGQRLTVQSDSAASIIIDLNERDIAADRHLRPVSSGCPLA